MKRIDKVYKLNKKLGSAIFCLAVGFAFLIFYMAKQKVYSKLDLFDISASLTDYSFIEHNDFTGQSYNYYLYLDGHTNTFQIIADFIKYFDRSSFENNMKVGDVVTLEITTKDFKNLNNQKRIKVFGISGKNDIFLDPKDTIQQFNSQLPLFGMVAFIIIGFITLVIYLDEIKTKKN
jgi:hypothetical protein